MLNPSLLPAIELEWRAHLADGLVRLRRTPAGGVRCDCDAIAAEPERHDLAMLLRRAAGELTQAERNQSAAAMLRFQGLDTVPIFLLRGGLPYQIAQASDPAQRAELQARLEALGDVDTPKAPALRKLLFPLLAARFGAKPAKAGGGEFRMPIGGAGPAALGLWLDFGGMARGIRWAVEVTDPAGGRRLASASYEGLLGIPVHAWDLLRTDQVEADLALLLDRIAETVRILGTAGR